MVEGNDNQILEMFVMMADLTQSYCPSIDNENYVAAADYRDLLDSAAEDLRLLASNNPGRLRAKVPQHIECNELFIDTYQKLTGEQTQ